MQRLETFMTEPTRASIPAAQKILQAPKSSRFSLRKRQRLESSGASVKVQAVLQSERRRQDNAGQADAASRPDTRHQTSATTASVDSYVPLNEARDIISDVVDANSPAPPALLKFCKSGQQVLLKPVSMPVNANFLTEYRRYFICSILAQGILI